MPAAEALSAILREWIRQAEGHLKNASHALKLGRECPTEKVAFHAQQCVEKYIKVALLFYEIEFPPRVYDIEQLVRLLPAKTFSRWPVTQQQTLTSYAVYAATARYPYHFVMARYSGDFEPISLREARQAVQIARRVRGQIRRLLPKSDLGKRSD
jgi:HEPN domain-containing protein